VAKKTTKSVRAHVTVAPRPEILDPQGQAIAAALARLGFDQVIEVRAGKSFEIELEGVSGKEAQGVLEEMCRKLLANEVVEDFRIELDENGSSA
jgi:phosphoribosylformylglycinamidine synthase